MVVVVVIIIMLYYNLCVQCFDAVFWVQEGHPAC